MDIHEYLSYTMITYVTYIFIVKVLPWIYVNIAPVVFGLRLNLCDYGKWALITGASDGIGMSFAKQLAKRGLNVILVSRTQAKLEIIAAEIESNYKVQTKVIAVDFTHDVEIYSKIAVDIQAFDIGILVNNIGICYDYPEYFLNVSNSTTTFDNIIRGNIHSVVFMTKIILPPMVRKGKGIIINLSSLSATIPTPFLTVYSASKAFDDKFTEDLSHEYSSQGIIVQSFTPSLVSTNMTKVEKSVFQPDADTFAAAAINSIGYSTHSAGYLPHAVQQLLLQIVFEYLPFIGKWTSMAVMKPVKRDWRHHFESSNRNFSGPNVIALSTAAWEA